MQKFLKKPGYQYLLMFASFLVFSCYSALATEYYVTTSSEITSAMNGAQPGDTLTMANGVWTDAHIVFEGNGTEDQPILLRSESPGYVILSGSSNLRIAGDYLIVDGLYFKSGYSSSGGVIEFRNGSRNLSNYCRLTNTAIENYNPANPSIGYKWVSLYGSHNRVDHCYFKGKNHIGTTLVVWFERISDPPAHYHLIDHNYFAHRSELGENGGETIRIGTSTYSMSDSYTIVEHNYFEYCNGEAEIISNKSCENIYRYNTFYECEGALTLRHGNRCTVYGNFFIGNRKSNTGGVRVIGEDHTIYNNYFCGLYGSSFRSALPVLNGVPNSPLNRYFQVKNAQIVFNTFFDCKYTMIIGAGADDERTLPPEDCIIANNLVKTNYQVIEQKAEPINMTWEGNIMQGSSLGIPQPEGITIIDPQLVLAEDSLWRPAEFSPAIGTATGDYDFVIDDMDGQPRDDGEKDIGGDEFSDVPVVNRPLTRNDVGSDWINSLDLPIAHWALDETEGDIAYDSASANDGTVHGDPAWQPDGGKVDGALAFDGIDDYVSTDFVLNPADGAFSVFAWIKGGAPGQVVISQTDGAGTGRSWLCTDLSDGKLMTELRTLGRGGSVPVVSQFVITDGAWHRIGFVWDGSYRYLYVDGAEVAKDTKSFSMLESSDGGLYLGAGNILDTASFFSGLIDDVRIYNRAVTP